MNDKGVFFVFGMGAAMLLAVVGQKIINFQEQEACYRNQQDHRIIQHRGFLGDTFYCTPRIDY